MSQTTESDCREATVESGAKKSMPLRSKLIALGALGPAAVCVATVVATQVKACMNEGTTVTSLGMVQPGHEKVRVDHHFTNLGDVEAGALRDARRSFAKDHPHIFFRDGTIKVESFDGDLFGKRQIVFTVETVSREQSFLEFKAKEKAEEEKEKAETKPVDVEYKGDNAYGFAVMRVTHRDLVIIKTINKFRDEHPNYDFTVVNVPTPFDNVAYSGHSIPDKDFYLIITSLKPETK